jgi:hypothetical protein
MTESIEDYRTSCRFCLQIKFKTILLTQFHILSYKELTGEELDENEQLPMTICLVCNHEMRKFQEYRTNLVENQRKLQEMLRKDENLIEIDSMAEIVPETFNNDEDLTSLSTESTISQNEIEILDDPDISTSEDIKSNLELQPSQQNDLKTLKVIPKIIKNSSQNCRLISNISKKSTERKIIIYPSKSQSSKLITEILRRSQKEKAKRNSNSQLNGYT